MHTCAYCDFQTGVTTLEEGREAIKVHARSCAKQPWRMQVMEIRESLELLGDYPDKEVYVRF